MKKNWRKRIFSTGLIIAILVLLIPIFVRKQVGGRIFDDIQKVESKEFAIVLGASITRDMRPGYYLQLRLNDAIALYRAGKIKKILLSGDNGDDAHDEISAMNNYLVAQGVPQNIIFGDYAGFDTYSTMERAAKIFDLKQAIVVSQGFHLPRALYLAQKKGIDATGFASEPSIAKKRYFLREYFATIKAVFDCFRHRKAKYYGKKVDSNGNSNIVLEQL